MTDLTAASGTVEGPGTPTGLVLGIESSCDETAAAVVRVGRDVLSSEVASQVALHAPFRGVVPEIAARAHEAAVMPLVDRALSTAGCGLADLDAIAVTHKPGLIGALLIGLAAAKGLSQASGKPLVGVDHLEAHVHSCRMNRDALPFPQLALVASGGHTSLFLSRDPLDFSLLSTTVDDAAGEAFDKVAGMLGLPYPGGAPIERVARGGAPSIAFPVARVKKRPLHFSFSGLKTALLYYLRDRGWNALEGEAPPPDRLPDIAASFQEAVVRALVETTRRAIGETRPQSVLVSGGVALNRRVREAFQEAFEGEGLAVAFPRDNLCGDNAAMIAGLGYLRWREGVVADLALDAQARYQ